MSWPTRPKRFVPAFARIYGLLSYPGKNGGLFLARGVLLKRRFEIVCPRIQIKSTNAVGKDNSVGMKRTR